MINLKAQELDTKVLLNSLNQTQNDSIKCQLLKLLFSIESDPVLRFDYNKNREAIALSKQELGLSPTLKNYYTKNLAAVYNNYGVWYSLMGDYNRSIDYYQKSILIKEKDLHDTLSIQNSLMSIAVNYKSTGQVKKALEVIYKSLKISKHYHDVLGEANALNHIAIIYSEMGDDLKAIENCKIALNKISETNDFRRKAEILNNIGVYYYNLNLTDSASRYWKIVLKIFEDNNDRDGLANILSNIGITYKLRGDYKKAEEHYLKGEEIYKTLPDRHNYPILLIDFSELYVLKKDYLNALVKAKKAEQFLQQQGNLFETSKVYFLLYTVYKYNGDSKQSLKYFEKYILLNDSLKSEENHKSAIRSQLKYEYEKRAAADSVTHAKSTEIKNAELAKQSAEIKAKKNQQYGLFGGLALVLVFTGFMYNRFKVTQKQKDIIESQKLIVEQQKFLVEGKQKEILDSIRYAQKIQKAHLVSESMIWKWMLRVNKFDK
ncbi:MAG: tetratricopeptide repeat protein [Sphingobacteriaceae bacterium]|nr:tetratricopeptide repeat protein [Sphingobacteriaceae bacterium]